MKNKRLLLILLGVLLILVALYVVLDAVNTRNSGQEQLDGQSSAIVICEFEDPMLLSYDNPNGTLTFSKSDGIWQYSSDVDFPVRQSDLALLCTTINGLTATRQLEGGEEISAYGFDKPTYAVTLGNTKGDALSILIGNAASNGDYYAMLEGSEIVYTISSSLPEILSKTLFDLYDLPAIPLSGGTIDSLTYTSTLEGLDPSYSIEGLAGSEMAETEAVVNLVRAWSGMAFSNCHVYQPDAAAVSQCGLDAPSLALSVRYAEGSGTKIELGAQTDTGGYYARLGGNEDIFILNADVADALISALATICSDGE